jgi:hypothetical protein
VSEGELLTGDGVTQGIVRIGDTVRRPLRPFSLTVQAYLAHLRDAGFAGAPSWSATATTTRATWSSATGCPSR